MLAWLRNKLYGVASEFIIDNRLPLYVKLASPLIKPAVPVAVNK